MDTPKRNVDFLIGVINGMPSIHVGRGYFKENGKYKTTLRIPVDEKSCSDVLFEQLSQFGSIFAIDTNKMAFGENTFTASCAVHLQLTCHDNGRWEATFSRLPAIIGLDCDGNPEIVAWVRIVEGLLKNIPEMVALVVDSELGKLPQFNAGEEPLMDNFYLTENVQLIYASAERDRSSPLNKAMQVCDKDATWILRKIKEQCDTDKVYSRINSKGFVAISPSYV